MADIQYSGYHTANEGMLYTEINMTSAKRSTPVNEERGKLRPNSWAKRKDRSINQNLGKSSGLSGNKCQPCLPPDTMEEDDEDQYMTAREDNDGDENNNLQYNDDDNLAFDADEDSANEDDIPNQQRQLMLQFREYSELAQTKFAPFTRAEVTAIKCLSVLRKTSASLGTYKDIMEWHLKETGALQENATVGETSAYVSQKRMYEKLRIRYNIQPEYYGVIKTLELPSSHTRVDIVTNDAGVMIRSLLTDPRVSDEDYLFFDMHIR
jgi:hypothetical protein